MYDIDVVFEPVDSLAYVDEPRVRVILFECEDGSRSIYDIMEGHVKNIPAILRRVEEVADYASTQSVTIKGDFDFGRARTFDGKFKKAFEQTILLSIEKMKERQETY